MIILEIIYLPFMVLCSVLSYYLPWVGGKLLTFRKIPISEQKETSFVLGIVACIAGVAIMFRSNYFWEALIAFIFLLLLLLISWIDWHTGYILDQLTIGGSLIIVGLQLVFHSSVLPSQLLSSVIIFLCLYILAKGTNRIGRGDAKLMAMCALLLNWQSMLLALWIASISGLIFIVIGALRKRIEIRQYALPFGPHLALGAFSSYLYGEQVLHLFFDKHVLSTLAIHIL